MKIKIIFCREKIKSLMDEKHWILPQLAFNWGISVKKARQIFDDAIYIESDFVSKISIIDSEAVIFDGKD